MVESSRVRRRREQRVCAKLNARYQYSRETTRRDASLLFLSLNSLSLRQNRKAQNVMIFCRWKSDKQTSDEKKKIEQIPPLFLVCVFPSSQKLFTRRKNKNFKRDNNETRTKRERNESENDERVFIICACVCVCAETVLY